MTATRAAGDALYAELVDRFGTAFPTLAGRVHRHRPPDDGIAAPCVFIDVARHRPTGDYELAVIFPVVVVVDGDDMAQRADLEDRVDVVITAGATVGEVGDSTPDTIPVGGPRLRSVTVAVSIPIGAASWCAPEHIGATAP